MFLSYSFINVNTKIEKIMQPDKNIIKAHISAFFEGHDYTDGKVEISTLKTSSYFDSTEIDAAVAYAEAQNLSGKNVYISGALFDPNAAPFGRSTDADFYASCMVWADIDHAHDPDALKALYAHHRPSYAVVTARKPHRRIQLWWKLSEAVTDKDALREALEGIAEKLGGDPAVKNITSLMRLAGTVNYPSEKKLAKGRAVELTEFIRMDTPSLPIEAIIKNYPVSATLFEQPAQNTPATKNDDKYHIQGFDVRLKDGRESYMSDLIYATILNYAEQHGAWPLEEQVLNEAWPIYERKVIATVQGGLDKEGRGIKAMRQKIRSKLRLFTQGRIKGHETPVMKHAPAEGFNPVTGEIKAQILLKKSLYYVTGKNIKYNNNDSSLIKDVLGQGELSVIYGESNCGKTFFMTDLAFHVARGIDWHGHRVTQGGVMYAALEGSKGLAGRFEAYIKKNNISPDIPFAMMPCALDFYSENANVQEFIDLIKASQDDIGDPKLIVIDTLSRALAGGDENSGQDMGRLVYFSDMIRRETAGHLSFVHHSGKNKALGARGHSSLRAAVDTEIEISRDEKATQSIVKFVKQREIEMIEDKAFTLERVVIAIDGFSDEITSCVVVPQEVEKTTRKTNLTPKERFVFEAINNALDKYGAMRTPYKNGPTLKTVTFDELAEILEEMGYDKMYKKDGDTTVITATKAARISLRDKNLIGFNAGGVWLLSN